ncbi:amidohydrolase [Qipengyuania gaetbuli]|uniref:Amidohydrolase family protein n=1 Tax=Qipengyuania gaetbuli TaxID=266952 RepID=A0A844XX08_9SPHN|nr:amidohydrolase [Qipengyuania gaetbuli]MBY6014939.1 amidohydrolase [Qipengyuania gaetbuli]MXO49889.1 amidohydrolase family protein [Qipengyuania gaetbuli]
MKKTLVAALLATTVAVPAQADVLVDNVTGITMDADGKVKRFEALVIDDDGKVAKVIGRGEDRPRTDYREDGKGRVMLPGMIDAHVHVMGVGFGALTLDLSETNSLEEALDKIRTFAAENEARPWILGRGWNQEKWGLGRFPTAAELDSAVADRPVYLERVDGHAGWANSLAMQAAGITAQSKSPAGGRIETLPGSKQPSGVFVDAAEELMRKAIPAPRANERDLALAEAQKVFHRYGITAVADMGTTIEDWQAFRRAGDMGALNLRIMSYASGPEQMVLIGGSGPSPWLYDDKLRMNGVKLYLDGALGSRGAWLKRPYADDPGNYGLPLQTPAQLRNILVRAAQGGFQPAVHAIGTAANAEVLNAVNEIAESFDGDRRWRIEHAQIIDPVDLPKIAENGIIASMQPLHQTSDRLMAEARLGMDRLEGAYAWNTVLQLGGKLAFGSDAPVEPSDVFAGYAAAITRMDANGQPFGGWLPKERVNREEALAGFTSDAAYAGFAEGRFGRLLPGERADFILVDRDPLMATPEEIRATKVLETWVGGRKVYDAD